MSFGISISDGVFVFNLIKRVVFICTTSSASQYQELIQEIDGLESTLVEIENQQCVPAQEPALNALKSVARRPKVYVQELSGRLVKFKALSNGGKTSRSKKLKARLRWAFTMADEVQKARNELVLYGIELRTQQIMFMMTVPAKILSPDLQRTWFQAPARLEDALGRVWPVPSEYSWAMLRAIILAMFKVGPGASKVAADEYALFPTGDCSSTFSTDNLLLPGQRISMAMIISHFEMTSIDQCPTPNCGTARFLSRQAGEVQCPQCHCSFHFDESSHYMYPQLEASKGHAISDKTREMLFDRMRLVARSTRSERSSFKNVRILLGTNLLTSLTYGKRCRMLLSNDQWPAEVTPVNSISVQENESQYANFEQYIQLMEKQPGASELILESTARDVGGNVPYVISQLDSLRATKSAL